ncbi:tRNA 2-selenouridine(34) synthase MnmH [Nioella sp. MMSF_3534]|uniref:tRNA 2-selenouridine(34) synthase MnmH n=1 Tax=Nioella sp. MMSF_3534 TaxID=3046720 RepID=UPI00273F7584|nr:tRNA 2-selenouridine(34) synthase MnmH [Nioella sp. MMSF_3534]
MSVNLGDLWDGAWHGFDAVIDVRAPAEFAEDHLPGAITLPVLSDEERARVGTIYKQVSPFDARKIGAALVARNAAAHIESQLMDKPGGWQPLVYCWRGGQRSNSFATILRQIGWRVEVLEGGYRSYRRAVVDALYHKGLPFRLIRLDGNTGTAKTALLPLLKDRGVQVVDLEGLAGHRGSILGAVTCGQPSQKGFESGLITAFQGLDPARPVVVEAESARIGALRLPPALWHAMIRAPRVEIGAPVPVRAAYLARAYADLLADPDELTRLLEGLRALVGAERVAEWGKMIAAQNWHALAEGLVVHHYDPAYSRARKRDDAPTAAVVEATELTEDALPDLADRLARVLGDIDPG